VNRTVRHLTLAGLLAVLVPLLIFAAGPALSVPTAVPGAVAPVRIMPLGDSITGSPGCWRALLWNQLQANGFTGIDFVGTQPPQGCGVPYDGDNEGHGGALATGIVSQNQLPGWLSATKPDIVLMHLGTNDVWSNLSTATILGAYTTLVGQMRASNPAMRIVVAQIIPMNPANCAACAQGVVNLDAAVPGWAAALSTAQSPISVVDQWTGFVDATDTADGVHPNDSGNQKMAGRWYSGLSPLLSPGSGSTTTTTTVSAERSCSATYSVTSQWSGGYQASVVVVNSGAVPVVGWRVGFALAAGQTVTQSWNASFGQVGGAVTFGNLGYNGALGAGAATSFGFLGGSTGVAGVPAVTCTAT
jgi:lysophospholipase L1-like esterase